LAQIGIATLACVGFSLLLGQGGLLSFGHALYFGAGAYGVAWCWTWLQSQGWANGLSLMGMPLLGGVGATLLASVIGLGLARYTGVGFAMLTLALGELAWALAQTGHDLFGGEAGLSLNRTALLPGLGLNFGSAFQMTVLVCGYTAWGLLTSAWLMRTPFGLALNAVRDQSTRAQSLGLAPKTVRYRALAVSAFYCGVAGGLYALFFEHVSNEVLGAHRSSFFMLFSILGGVRFWAGPILGGVFMVLAMGWLSHFTPAWMLYVGLLFTGVVLWTPQGLAGWMLAQPYRLEQMGAKRYLLKGLAQGAAVLCAVSGAVALIEMTYQWQERSLLGDEWPVWGFTLNTASPVHWLVAAAVFGWGLGVLHLLQRAKVPTDLPGVADPAETSR
jgi:branched-chain amino acid transport system permease protein